MTITSSYNGRYMLQNDQSLIIESIQASDEGTFTCGFITNMGFIYGEINVRVTNTGTKGFLIVEPTLRNIQIRHEDGLNLTCRVNINPDLVNISWILPGTTIIHNSTLVFRPGQVMAGLYRCFAHNAENERHHSVFVTVNAKPKFTMQRISASPVVRSFQGYRLERNEATTTMAPLVGRNNINIEWKKKDSNSVMDFGSRLKVTWSQKNVQWIIRDAQLEDTGEYFMNISNDFGFTVLSTQLEVIETEMLLIQVQVSDQDCELLKVR